MSETTPPQPVYLSYRDAVYQQSLRQEAVERDRANVRSRRRLQPRNKRPRLPDRFAIVHFCCRIIGVCISIVVLTLTLFLLDKWDVKLYYCLAAPAWCILLDFTEIIPLLDITRKVPRLRFSALAILEAPAFSVAVAGLINIGSIGVPHDVSKWTTILWWVTLGMALWRFAFLVSVCFCIYWERKEQRVANCHAKQGIQLQSTTSRGESTGPA